MPRDFLFSINWKKNWNEDLNWMTQINWLPYKISWRSDMKSAFIQFRNKTFPKVKGELQRKNKLTSYQRAFKMLENDLYIAGIGQTVLELLSFKVESGNHQRGISLLQKFSDIFGNLRLVPLKMTSHLTSHNFQILKIEIFSKLCKIWTYNFNKW